MNNAEAGRTEEEVLSDLYDPDRKIRIKSAREFTEGLAAEISDLGKFHEPR